MLTDLDFKVSLKDIEENTVALILKSRETVQGIIHKNCQELGYTRPEDEKAVLDHWEESVRLKVRQFIQSSSEFLREAVQENLVQLAGGAVAQIILQRMDEENGNQ